jgi:hypothetical protein
LQSVSDQKLEGAVEADMRQDGLTGSVAFEQGRAKAQEAEIGVVGGIVSETTKSAFAGKQRFRVERQIARKRRDFGVAIERLAIAGLARGRRPQ